jgi:hypothetical protein
MKKRRIGFLGLLLGLGALPFTGNAQQKIGGATGAADPNAYLQLGDATGANKGLLLSRVALTATSAASPLTAHVAGMTVYNTATAGSGNTAVTPGYYYNDGSKWVRIAATNDFTAMAWIPGGNTNGALKAIGTNDNFDLPFETNGVERMRLTTGGNLGLGTTAPGAKLHILSSFYNGIRLQNGNDNASIFNDGNLHIETDSSLNSTLWINKNGSGLVSIAAGGGNVGIGSATPAAKLDITGNIKINDGTQGNGKVLVSDANGVASWQSEGSHIAGQNVTAGSNKVTLGGTPTGAALKPFSIDVNEANININNLLGPLNLNKIAGGGATTNQSPVWNGSAWVPGTVGATAWMQGGNTNGALQTIGTNDNFDLPVETNGTEKMRLNTNGLLGIGNTTPTTKLHILSGSNNGIRLQNGNDNANIFNDGNLHIESDNTSNSTLWINGNGSGMVTIATGGGNVGIGSATPAAKLDITGNIKINDGTQGVNKVLTSDANGVASWKPSSIDIYSAPLGSGVKIPSTLVTSYLYSNTSITLPPGKWLVNVTMILAKENGPTGPNENWWVRSTFSDSPSSGISSDIVGNKLISGGTGVNAVFSLMTGAVVINNTSGNNKTYYYMVGSIGGSSGFLGSVNASGNLNYTGGSTWNEDYITYQRIN